eukprot:173207-Amphidinium_carterae.1
MDTTCDGGSVEQSPEIVQESPLVTKAECSLGQSGSSINHLCAGVLQQRVCKASSRKHQDRHKELTYPAPAVQAPA